MKIVLFGANGRVGRLLTQALLDRNHEITAFVHGSFELEHQTLRKVVGDIHDASLVSGVIAGQDVVVSTLGSWGTPQKDILSSGVANMLAGMETHGVQNIVTLTGTAALLPQEKVGLLTKFDRQLLARIDTKVLLDGERHLALLNDSSSRWTSLRSPIMNTKGNANAYHINNRHTLPFATVHRGSVVQALVAIIEDQDPWLSQAPCLHRG